MDNKDKKKVLCIIDKILTLASDGEHIYRGQPNIVHRTVTSTLYRAMEDAMKSEMKDAMKDAVKDAMEDVMKDVMEGEMKDEEKNAIKDAIKGAMKDVIKDVMKERGGGIEGADWLDMNQVQEEELKIARDFDRRFKDKNDDNIEILSHIQHYSGDTNLIDFTKDYLVALFFACNAEYGESDGADGNVFLIKVSLLEGKGIKMINPVNPNNRVTAQKSVFLQPSEGVISTDIIESVLIPLELKQPILSYLKAYHDISLSNIYNDLHGYIRNRKEHDNIVMEFYLALYYSYKSEKVYSSRGKMDASEKAIEHYDKVIQMDPKHVTAYSNRGLAKVYYGDSKMYYEDANRKLRDESGAISSYNDAISDCDKAIDMNSEYVTAYYNRGLARERLGDRQNLKQALSDFKNAKKLALWQNRKDVTDAAKKSIKRVTVKIAELDNS